MPTRWRRAASARRSSTALPRPGSSSPGRPATPDEARSLAAPVAAAIEASLGRVGGEVATIVRSGSFASASVDPDEVDLLTALAWYDGIERHAALTAGEWPRVVVATHDPLMLDVADRVLELRDGALLDPAAPLLR